MILKVISLIQGASLLTFVGCKDNKQHFTIVDFFFPGCLVNYWRLLKYVIK